MSNRAHPTDATLPLASVHHALIRLTQDAASRGDGRGAEAWAGCLEHVELLERRIAEARRAQTWGRDGETVRRPPPKGEVLGG